MTNEQKFLIEINVDDVVTNRHETNPAKLVYVSDVLQKWIKYNNAMHSDGDKLCLCPGGIGACGFGDPDTNICNHPRR